MSIIYSVSLPVKQEHLVLFGLVLRIILQLFLCSGVHAVIFNEGCD